MRSNKTLLEEFLGGSRMSYWCFLSLCLLDYQIKVPFCSAIHMSQIGHYICFHNPRKQALSTPNQCSIYSNLEVLRSRGALFSLRQTHKAYLSSQDRQVTLHRLNDNLESALYKIIILVSLFSKNGVILVSL